MNDTRPLSELTPPERLQRIVANARTESADTLKYILLGISVPHYKAPAFMGEGPPIIRHRSLEPLPYRYPPYAFRIAWDDDTGRKLQDVIDHPPDPPYHLVREAEWLLSAWEEWQKTQTIGP
jgi:hypothetical protein